MLNFREFEAGPDPFGRKWQVLLKWMQTAISIRHADTVDVKFVLTDPDGERTEKTIALPHAGLLQICQELDRALDDPWCCRIAATHLLYLVATGEDMEKDLVTLTPAEMKRIGAELSSQERSAIVTR